MYSYNFMHFFSAYIYMYMYNTNKKVLGILQSYITFPFGFPTLFSLTFVSMCFTVFQLIQCAAMFLLVAKYFQLVFFALFHFPSAFPFHCSFCHCRLRCNQLLFCGYLFNFLFCQYLWQPLMPIPVGLALFFFFFFATVSTN